MKNINVVGIMVELEEGLTKNQVIYLTELLPDGETVVPFEVSANNSTIYGFMTVGSVDEHFESVIATATMLCEDFDNERIDKTYKTETGIEMFIDFESETIRGDSDLRSFSSSGMLVDVITEEKIYSSVLICPKPQSPWIHLLEYSNGDVVEVKTASIVSVEDGLPF